ncbi:MAG: sarcosine oxidase subunit delta [Cohaesibacteraceae bacterium]|nr:sarcosine oxidase subunit delta [Cohaesibacteraceae bacterium]MBL4875835.1 sarcosine oxidase subunit delta [Cohaesibacteraceae bacterium]MBL4876180.1 sarcosine oxidase subunit delta [Cohaesibacteraceae bacterium]
MLQIKCPVCKIKGDETDFSYGGEAHIYKPGVTNGQPPNMARYLYIRSNPRGVQQENWRCSLGCNKWFTISRHTISQEILATYKLRETPHPNLSGKVKNI